MTSPTQREAVARIIDPDAWLVLDIERKRFPADPPERFLTLPRVAKSLFKADQIISSLQDRWRDIASAPMDGTQFLAALSNGWVTIVSAPAPNPGHFAWWTHDRLSIPIVSTHRPGSLGNCILAVAWMPLPPIPSSLKGSDVGEVGE